MAIASGVTLVIDASRLPLFDGMLAIVAAITGRAAWARIATHFATSCVRTADDLHEELEALLYDPQTSGGL